MKRRRGPFLPRTIFLLTLLIFVGFTIQGLWMINKGIEPTIMSYAKTKSSQLAKEAINDAISKRLANEIDINKLIVSHEREGSEKVSYSFDPSEYNSLITQVHMRVERHLELLENGNLNEMEDLKLPDDVEIERDEEELQKEQGVVLWVPLGLATRNALLSNLGPKVPVRLEIIGEVASEIRTKMEKVGINNTYIEMFIDLNVQLNVIIPSATDNIVVTNSIKIGDLFIEGTVPDFYIGDGGSGTMIPVVPNSSGSN
jgi:sporulation protein YunB